MATAGRITNEKDFYNQLMNTIEAGNSRRAAEMISAVEEPHSRLEILNHLTNALAASLNVRGANTLDLDRARALMRTRDRAVELKQSLDLEHAHAVEAAIERARALYLNLDRAMLINKTLIACFSDAQFASANPVQSARSSSMALKNSLDRFMTFGLLCSLIGIATTWMMVARI